MHDEFLNQRHGTFFFIAILDGILFLRCNEYEYIPKPYNFMDTFLFYTLRASL
jgi:hypothetical protein